MTPAEALLHDEEARVRRDRDVPRLSLVVEGDVDERRAVALHTQTPGGRLVDEVVLAREDREPVPLEPRRLAFLADLVVRDRQGGERAIAVAREEALDPTHRTAIDGARRS